MIFIELLPIAADNQVDFRCKEIRFCGPAAETTAVETGSCPYPCLTAVIVCWPKRAAL
jgi:hypothetical protein